MHSGGYHGYVWSLLSSSLVLDPIMPYDFDALLVGVADAAKDILSTIPFIESFTYKGHSPHYKLRSATGWYLSDINRGTLEVRNKAFALVTNLRLTGLQMIGQLSGMPHVDDPCDYIMNASKSARECNRAMVKMMEKYDGVNMQHRTEQERECGTALRELLVKMEVSIKRMVELTELHITWINKMAGCEAMKPHEYFWRY